MNNHALFALEKWLKVKNCLVEYNKPNKLLEEYYEYSTKHPGNYWQYSNGQNKPT
jgi:hypothetical protein